MSKVFLYREKNSFDRDCCAYIEDQPVKFVCGHYFSSITLHGSCYCGSDWKEYEEIETILTKTEYEQLCNIDKKISLLGFGIKQEDDRYKTGMSLQEKISPIIERLTSPEAKNFYEKIIS